MEIPLLCGDAITGFGLRSEIAGNHSRPYQSILFQNLQFCCAVVFNMNFEALDKRILSELDKRGSVDTLELAIDWKLDHQVVVGAVKSLDVLDEVSSLTYSMVHQPSIHVLISDFLSTLSPNLQI